MLRLATLMLVSAFLIQGPRLQAQSNPKLITSVEGINEYELNNGLRILLIPDATQSNIAVNIVYKVGSRHEGYGEKGMAHLLEHMLFKQCEKFTDIKKAIADKGAWANGTTWYDRTNYYEILSASDENLRWAIDMEADRMVNSKILPEELQKEFSVVRNEFEIGENNPDRVLIDRTVSTMYLWHNYGNSTIGSKEDIERVKAENLKVFYKKFYQPDNAVLVIAGKFDEKKALDYIQQYFGPIPRPTRTLSNTYTVEPVQDGEREVSLRRNGDVQYLALGYHTPSTADVDYVANDVLLEILTNDPAGILYKKMVDGKLATKVFGYSLTLHDPGFTYIQCEIPKDRNLDSAKRVLIQTMDGIGNMNITQADLDNARNSRMKFFSNTSNNTIDLSIVLTELIGAGDWRLWFWSRDQLEKLSLQQVKDAAKKYYKPSNRTVAYFIPEAKSDRTRVSETPDIAKLLDGYKGKEMAAKKAEFENSIANIKKNTEYGKLANGAQYALLEKPVKGDKINAVLALQIGDENSLTNKSEIAAITARMLKYGTKTRTKKQINEELDRLKTEVSFYSSPGRVSVVLNTDKANLANALALLDDLLHNPSFDAEEFEKLKKELRTEYETSKSDPNTLAFTRVSKMLTKYPKGHPLYPSDSDENIAALDKITLADVKKFYADFYGANNAVTTFVGEIDKNLVKSFMQKSLSKWNSKLPYKEIESKYFDIKGSTESITVEDKTNATMAGGINLKLSEKSADYPAVYMANELLGGGAFLSSRIPQRLRENEGMSYGAGSYLDAGYKSEASIWGLYAMYNPLYRDRLDSALHQEIDKAISGGFTSDELSKSVDSWLEQNKTSLGMNNMLASMINRYLRQGRDLTEVTAMENKVKALDVKTVNEALRKYFDKSKMIIINSGDFRKKGF
jgi:zinc protease